MPMEKASDGGNAYEVLTNADPLERSGLAAAQKQNWSQLRWAILAARMRPITQR